MLKLLFILVLFYYVAKLLKIAFSVNAARRAAQFRHESAQGNASEASRPAPKVILGEMTACDACGTYVVKTQTISSGGKRYCSQNCVKSHS